MFLNRSASSASRVRVSSVSKSGSKSARTLPEFLAKKDFVGALTLLEFQLKGRVGRDFDNLMWIGYCSFHLGNFRRSIDAYTELLLTHNTEVSTDVNLYIAASYFFMQDYVKAEEYCLKGPTNGLRNRIMFHVAQRTSNEQKLVQCHQKLVPSSKEDQLSLAAMHFIRSHFQEATDVCKRLLLENRDDLALNLYVAMCYYRLDYYDVSTDMLNVYLQAYPDSLTAINLKACNQFKLYNGKAAEAELRNSIASVSQQMSDTSSSNNNIVFETSDLIRHNLVVFSGGEGAASVLPSLVSTMHEAKLNYILYNVKQWQHHGGSISALEDALGLAKEVDPASPQEFIIKANVLASLGQEIIQKAGSISAVSTNLHQAREYVRTAQQYYNLVGASSSECDTIPGRQSMASFFFLSQQFDDAIVYFNSIKAYMYGDDDFNWNYGLALANAAYANITSGNSTVEASSFKQAEEALLQVQSEAYRSDFIYISWLCRCFIMNGSPKSAWDLYTKHSTTITSIIKGRLLRLIADDCYRMGFFFVAAKAFDALELVESAASSSSMTPGAIEAWEGKRGAIVGVFQQFVASFLSKSGNVSINDLQESLNLLRSNKGASTNPQVEYIMRTIKKWAKDNNLKI